MCIMQSKLSNLFRHPKNFYIILFICLNFHTTQFSKKKNTQRLPKRNRGEGTTLRAVMAGKEIYFTNWMDKKPVNMLHTIPSFNSTCSRWVKKKQQVLCKVGRSERKGFFQPGVFRRYNEGMGAVDSQDQRLEAYRSSVKTRSW